MLFLRIFCLCSSFSCVCLLPEMAPGHKVSEPTCERVCEWFCCCCDCVSSCCCCYYCFYCCCLFVYVLLLFFVLFVSLFFHFKLFVYSFLYLSVHSHIPLQPLPIPRPYVHVNSQHRSVSWSCQFLRGKKGGEKCTDLFSSERGGGGREETGRQTDRQTQ